MEKFHPLPRRLWINLTGLAASSFEAHQSRKKDSPAGKDPMALMNQLVMQQREEERRDQETGGLSSVLGGGGEELKERLHLRETNPWLRHMCLGRGAVHDGMSDPV